MLEFTAAWVAIEILLMNLPARLEGLQLCRVALFRGARYLVGHAIEVRRRLVLMAAHANVPERKDDPAKLRAPVAQVILANDAVALEREEPGDGVADDSAAEVAHVHFFGDV